MAGQTGLKVSGNLSTSTARSGRPTNVVHTSRIVSTFRIADTRRTDRDARGASDLPMSKLCNRRRDKRSAKTPRTDIAFQLALLADCLKRSTRHRKQGLDSPTPTDRDDVFQACNGNGSKCGAHTTCAFPPRHEARARWLTLGTTSIAVSRSTPSDASGGMSRLPFGCKPPEPSHRAKNWHQTGTGRARNDEGLATAQPLTLVHFGGP